LVILHVCHQTVEEVLARLEHGKRRLEKLPQKQQTEVARRVMSEIPQHVDFSRWSSNGLSLPSNALEESQEVADAADDRGATTGLVSAERMPINFF